MIRVTRRGALAGALAVPTVAGLAHWRWRHGERSVLLHDPALEAGRRFAAAGEQRGGEVRAIEGDRVRFAKGLLAERPALIAGVSRHADFILIEDVAREARYRSAATVYGRVGQCAGHECSPGWQSLGRLASAAGQGWVEALAEFAVKPGAAGGAMLGSVAPGRSDAGLVLGWVLAPLR
ncbi:hypothetical protein GRI75_10925 [Altererythrobacter soli]|uniref:Uncharacterized protein n=1 Tax=Croceibacterium soli TaxID=1739690 RepID=A0A6I4UX53_9SPHN|nr:hypothetical protein [Croceibacterium soli]MXP42153.1 hypothetical protein [Croceibacterium soli]